MNRLDEIQRKCVELRKQGDTYKAIGKQLGITRNAVAGHLHRARQATLKQGLKDDHSRAAG